MSPFSQLSDPLSIVSTAVTPVVMVSATAILVSGVNARYLAVADRMRNLAQEFRSDVTKPERRVMIHRQMVVFRWRLELVSWASRILYLALGCFVSVALLICLATWRQILTMVTLPIFILGVGLVGAAIVLQFFEVQASLRTITLECSEALDGSYQ